MVIVAAIDTDGHAPAIVEEAVSLAVAFDDDIHVVHVMNESEANERRRATADEPGGPIDETGEKEIAARAAKNAVGEDMDDLSFVGLVGEPSDRIVDYVREVDARYVVIGPRKRSPAGKVLFGSVAQQVLLNSSVPTVSVITDADNQSA